MQMTFDGFPGHRGMVGLRLPDGSLLTAAERPADVVGYRAMCSCGWQGAQDHPPAEEGGWAVSSEWGRHMQPYWASTPPEWLLNRADSVRENVATLAATWPLQALGVLAEIERWQKPLIERSVVAARAAGHSWAEIGAALGITKQSAHERFNAVARKQDS